MTFLWSGFLYLLLLVPLLVLLYPASSARELHEIFNRLPTGRFIRQESSELSAYFAAGAAALAALALALALLWHPLL